MPFIIKHSDGRYFHNKGRIILFETDNQAVRFLQDFIVYAQQRLLQEGNQHEAMICPITIQSNSHIMPIDFRIEDAECGTVYVTDI